MTAAERVRIAQGTLSGGALARAVAWGLAAAFGLLAISAFVAVLAPELATDRGWHRVAAMLVGALVTASLLWRSRHLRSRQRVALWIEERIPALQYALVTAVEPGRTPHDGMESQIARHDIGRVTRGALVRTVVPAVVAAAIALLLWYASPALALGGGRLAARIDGSRTGPGAAAASRLEGLVVQVTPPAYARERATTLTDPASVSALVGSRLEVRGRGEPTGVHGSLGASALSASRAGRGWTITIAMPATPAALTLRDRGFDRILVLDPRADAAPRVVLSAPRRDSTLRTPRGSLELTASASDDVGLGSGQFEYLVSSGSGEVFTAKTITTPLVRFGGAPVGSLSATLDLASLSLGEGDVVSIRAIVQDANTLNGPGLGASDTRTFRIARADEYDSVSVEAAAPARIDSSAMSQRMIILMTERLVREQGGLTRQRLVRRSTEIAELEDRIRLRVHEILFPSEAAGGEAGGEGGSAPETHAHSEEENAPKNADLLAAYNALWEAVRSLRIAEPAPALPPMRVALAALDKVRLANRLYLRGTPPPVIVDLSRVRMTGKEKGAGSLRTPLLPADSARSRLATRFAAALDLLPGRSADAVRALTLLQVDALASAPPFGVALGEALEAFRRGRDATLPLLRARRALLGEPSASPGLSPWGGW